MPLHTRLLFHDQRFSVFAAAFFFELLRASDHGHGRFRLPIASVSPTGEHVEDVIAGIFSCKAGYQLFGFLLPPYDFFNATFFLQPHGAFFGFYFHRARDHSQVLLQLRCFLLIIFHALLCPRLADSSAFTMLTPFRSKAFSRP